MEALTGLDALILLVFSLHLTQLHWNWFSPEVNDKMVP